MPRLTVFLLLFAAVLSACSEEPKTENKTLTLATTTSTRDSGLLDVLLPVFEKQENCRVDVVAVGTGAALKLGTNGDADVVLVHAKKSEEIFVREGHADRREEFMVNYFMILGPESDPAGIKGKAPTQALAAIAAKNAAFASRGDDSGTHKKEMALRKAAGVETAWTHLFETGQGMGATLLVADEKDAYVLSDAGTYANFAKKMRLKPLIMEHELLRNPYAVMPISEKTHPGLETELANKFADFLISEKAQELIRDYQIEGKNLFFPTRLKGLSGN